MNGTGNPVILRPARDEDATTITEIWYAGWGDGHLGNVPEELEAQRSYADFARRASAMVDRTIVAELDSEVVGFVTIQDDEIEQIYLAASARGSGTANELLRAGERAVAERHPSTWLAVVAGNARARRFYERNGWVDEGPFDYSAHTADGAVIPVPAHRYRKNLTADEP